ncbi:MAG TPA: hypothetical protein VIG99_01150 [Myxococcaceae bacterium]
MVARTTVVLLVLLGLWARCANFRTVFPAPGQVELLPSDSHYYTRFARLQLHAFPRYQAFDPYVSFPEGARIILPPVHAEAVAAAVAIAGQDRAELGAAWVGPALSVLWLAGLVWLAWGVMGAGPALALAALLGLTPVLVDAGALGNADHHLHEGFLGAAVSLAMMALIRAPSRRTAVLVGVLLGTGRLLTPSAFMFVPCAAVAATIAGWARPADQGAYARAVGVAGLVAAVFGVAAAAVFGSLESLEYEEVSTFHPLLALMCFGGAFGAVAMVQDRRHAPEDEVMMAPLPASPEAVAQSWARMLADVMKPPFMALMGAVLIGRVLVEPMRGALAHLGRADPLLALVTESQPLWRDPRWALQLLGVLLPALPLGLYLARRVGLQFLAPLCLVVPLLGAAALQARFAPALAGSAAVLLAACFAHIGSARLRRVAAVVGAAPLALSLVPPPKQAMPADIVLVRPTLQWMRDHLPPASPDPYDGQGASYGVVASYLLGHTLPLWSERPSVGTFFSQVGVYVEGNRRAADVLAATTDEEAYRRAVATGARYVLVTPSDRILGHDGEAVGASALGKLLESGWMASPEDTTGHFRLVHDSAELRRRPEGGSYARLFEVVPGAVLRGSGLVRAVGPEVGGRTYAPAAREQVLRASYPGRYQVVCASGATGSADVSEDAVRKGTEFAVKGCGG